ncbi:integrase core domain-containing protein, partial [Gilliamella sp. Choc5-1]|uniref:integrase core domain-containing protein n=1 Tax=Gilliamella sp. Choc5-1 TaxID=3120238 RepID=UPI000A805EDC
LIAADMLNDKVLPFFDSEQVPLLRILTDRGTEYNGHKESHAYELYLNLEDIEHTKTKAYSPQTNGICERFHKTMKTECYDILFRRKIYTQLSEIQNDIEQWLEFYNRERAHSGKYCYGRTPWQTWNDAKGLVKEKQLENLFCSSDTHFVKMQADE